MKSLSRRSRSLASIIGVDVDVVVPESLKTPLRFTLLPVEDRDEQRANTFEEQIDDARATGYAAGHAAGVAEAMTEVEQKRTSILETTARQLVEATAAATQLRDEIVKEVVTDAVDLALEIVQFLHGERLDQSENPTRDAVLHALKLAPEGESLIVRVAPESSIDTSALLLLTRGAPIVIKEDPTIAPGDCIVQVGACRIERQLDAALTRVRVELEHLRMTTTRDAM